MKKDVDVDCQVFGDQLDGLVRGDLPHEGERQLRLHAEACPECAMQLRVQEHLVRPSLEELEAQVPEEFLVALWSRVEEDERVGVAGATGGAGGSVPEISPWPSPGGSGDRPGPPAAAGRRFPLGWVVPALAAATLVLLFSTGFLALELDRLRDREAVLAQQVAEQQRWLAELEVGPDADPVARTAALAGRSPWLRALSRQESITVQDLRLLLERMPGDRIILTRAQLEDALRSRTPLSMPVLREVLAGIETRDGVRTRDLLQALAAVGLSPGTTVPTADLMSLLS
ncbi:MAG: hypothetical protein ACWGSQ_08515 [Longimicrobiales bacterium]